MAQNLTTQVRGFAQISVVATDGDSSPSRLAEMDSVGTQINQMVFNLRDSIQKTTATREAAELANRSKSEFLVKLLHEIRYVIFFCSWLSLVLTFWFSFCRMPHQDDGAYAWQRS